ncbi:hypothetical protein RCH12_001064 [Cryobacterium sp. MP_3.1]|nr:hypothetical protein [Cryobacterium sp. MP_3.1]
MAEPCRIRCFEPATDAVRRGRQQDVRPAGDDRRGIGGDLRVVGRGSDADRRGMQNIGAASFERGDEVLTPAVGRDSDAEALELVRSEAGQPRFCSDVVNCVSDGSGG